MSVIDEILQARKKLGACAYPDGLNPKGESSIGSAKIRERSARRMGTLTWRQQLDTKVALVLVQEHPADLRTALIEMGAVLTAWAEDIEERSSQ